MEPSILGADAAEAEELGIGDHILSGRWVRGGIVQVAVGVAGLEIDVSFRVFTRDGDREVQEGEGVIRDDPGEFEAGVKGGLTNMRTKLPLILGASQRPTIYHIFLCPAQVYHLAFIWIEFHLPVISPSDQLVHIFLQSKVTKKIDEGRVVSVAYMDFSKAFNKVPHGRLVSKVRSHGIQGEIATQIQNWLD
eukprot:g30687.t1